MKTIIFGCGYIGMQTLSFIGKERIDFFCDNNSNVWGEHIQDIEILSYDEMLKLYAREPVLLILGVNGLNGEAIAEQMEEDGITDFILAELLPGFARNGHIADADFEGLLSREKRQEYTIRYLRNRLVDQRKKVEYFKRHASISHMSPAVGKLRDEQLDKVKLSREVMDFLENNCPVKCWITAGTLIGKLRHDGFIPWDNDIDFGIMRDDINKLLEFFEKYSTVFIPDYNIFLPDNAEQKSDKKHLKTLEEVAEEYKGKYFICIFLDFIRVYIKRESELAIALELFSFDYYAEDLSIEEYQAYVSEGFMMKRNLPSHKAIFQWCYDKIENSGIVSKEPTNKILPGVDSFIYRGLWNIEEFLPADAIFPLHEVEFEGEKFYSVNNPQRYMIHEYPEWENFPNDVGADE